MHQFVHTALKKRCRLLTLVSLDRPLRGHPQPLHWLENPAALVPVPLQGAPRKVACRAPAPAPPAGLASPGPSPWVPPAALSQPGKTEVVCPCRNNPKYTQTQNSQQWHKMGPSIYYRAPHKKPTLLRKQNNNRSRFSSQLQGRFSFLPSNCSTLQKLKRTVQPGSLEGAVQQVSGTPSECTHFCGTETLNPLKNISYNKGLKAEMLWNLQGTTAHSPSMDFEQSAHEWLDVVLFIRSAFYEEKWRA